MNHRWKLISSCISFLAIIQFPSTLEAQLSDLKPHTEAEKVIYAGLLAGSTIIEAPGLDDEEQQSLKQSPLVCGDRKEMNIERANHPLSSPPALITSQNLPFCKPRMTKQFISNTFLRALLKVDTIGKRPIQRLTLKGFVVDRVLIDPTRTVSFAIAFTQCEFLSTFSVAGRFKSDFSLDHSVFHESIDLKAAAIDGGLSIDSPTFLPHMRIINPPSLPQTDNENQFPEGAAGRVINLSGASADKGLSLSFTGPDTSDLISVLAKGVKTSYLTLFAEQQLFAEIDLSNVIAGEIGIYSGGPLMLTPTTLKQFHVHRLTLTQAKASRIKVTSDFEFVDADEMTVDQLLSFSGCHFYTLSLSGTKADRLSFSGSGTYTPLKGSSAKQIYFQILPAKIVVDGLSIRRFETPKTAYLSDQDTGIAFLERATYNQPLEVQIMKQLEDDGNGQFAVCRELIHSPPSQNA